MCIYTHTHTHAHAPTPTHTHTHPHPPTHTHRHYKKSLVPRIMKVWLEHAKENATLDEGEEGGGGADSSPSSPNQVPPLSHSHSLVQGFEYCCAGASCIPQPQTPNPNPPTPNPNP